MISGQDPLFGVDCWVDKNYCIERDACIVIWVVVTLVCFGVFQLCDWTPGLAWEHRITVQGW